jgi:hypothetical protein
LSTVNLFWYITLSAVPKLSVGCVVDIVVPVILTLPMLASVLTSTCGARVVPVTSKSYWGVALLMPMRLLFTSKYSKSF